MKILNKLRRTESRKTGFTLIELIVVMAVIAILVLLAAPKFLGYTQKAEDTKYIHTAKVIETALEVYLINGGEFPDNLEVVDTALLNESASLNNLIGTKGYVISVDGSTYYELTEDFIENLDVKLTADAQQNKFFVEAFASSAPRAIYSSTKGVTILDKSKTLKGYGESPIVSPEVEIKPTAVITMTPEQAIMTNTSIQWSSTSSTDSDGNTIAQEEWEGKQDVYPTEGEYSVRLRVQDERGIWSDWTVKTFYVISAQEVVEIVASVHTLALLRDGTVKSWGWNPFGQLGDGTKIDNSTPKTIPGLINVKSVAIGDYHSLALLTDGTVMAWGYNQYGQLGNGTTGNSLIPKTIPGLTNVKSIIAGNSHSTALLNDGTVVTWGNNGNGQLGDGTKTLSTTPKTIPGIMNVKSIAVGQYHTLVLLTDGIVKAWGYNGYGALGDGTKIDALIPKTISGFTNVRSFEAGGKSTFAIYNDGTVKAWGYNVRGQLGDGTTTDSLTPKAIPELTNVKSLKISSKFHGIALLTDGTVKSWGFNSYGELGDGTKTINTTPKTIPGLINVKSIVIGSENSFSMLNDGSIKAWGWNAYGQLGDGTNTDRTTPTSIQIK